MQRPNKTTHTKRLKALSCVITDSNVDLELHHCLSGSISDQLQVYKGCSIKNNEFFQIPLAKHLHVGNQGIHIIGVDTWEQIFGMQVDLLNQVSEQLDYDVIAYALELEKEAKK